MGAPVVKCPTCERSLEWSESSPFRPFCSERCRLIDLGAWLSEERAIPEEGSDFKSDPSSSSPPADEE
jgi:endogenous inhibitor of DNA gyrase (YacG/DUF329 family)